MVDEAEGASPSDGAPDYSSATYWIKRTKETEKVFKRRWWNAAKEAWAEYELGDCDGDISEEGTGEKVNYSPKLIPMFWSCIKTIAPAYFSKTPIPIGNIRYGVTDPVSRTAAKLIERLGVYALETTPFEETIRDAVMEYIISDACSTRVMLEADPVRVQVMEGDDGQFYQENGKPYAGQVYDGDDGNVYGEDGYENHKCYAMSLSYDDMMWTHTASSSDEIDERWYRFCYPEHEAYAMFPEIDREELKSCMKTYRKGEEKQVGNNQADEDSTYYLHGWEIWHKPTKKTVFITEDYKKRLLKEKEDSYKLRDFFPSPCPIVGTQQRKSLFGIPTYRYLKPLLEEMHTLAKRIFTLADEARIRFICDGEYEVEIREGVKSDEGTFIFIDNLLGIVEKGGLANIIQALPVGELQRAIPQLASLYEEFKQQFHEMYGVPDVLRGASDPLETAKAQEIKNFSASNRFRDQMNQVAALARDTLELLIDLKIGAYPPERILAVTGAKYMSKADQEKLPQAYALIQNDTERMIRLDFETDSTSYINEMIAQQHRNVAVQTVTQGLAAINGMPPIQQAIGFKTIQSTLAGLRLGKEFMDELDELFQIMTEQAKQPPPPQPNVEMLKVQMEQQKLQLKAQETAQKAQESAAKIQSEQMKAALNQRLEEFKLQIAAQSQSADLAVKMKEQERRDLEFQVEAQKTLNEASIAKAREQLDRTVAEFTMMIEAQRLQIERTESKMNSLETIMEETRLGKQMEADNLRSTVELLRAKNEVEVVPPAPTAPPVINIENIIPEQKPRRKRGAMVRDDGSRVELETEDLDD